MKISQDEQNLSNKNKEKSFYKNKISTDIISLSEKETLSRFNQLTSVTKKGLTFHSSKKFWLISEKRLLKFLNQPVELFLSHYELPLFGIIKKIGSIEKDLFEICIDFTETTPLYYRECVTDLLN